ncbi:MAG: hypothetical protein R3B90_21750 [Planctomycetaceae bacterium]
MPDRPTLLDLMIQNGNDTAAGLLDEAAIGTPEVTGMFNGVKIPRFADARPIKGTSYNTLVRTRLPQVGFRDANEAPIKSKGTYEKRRVETYILNPRWECDKAVADQHEDGPEAYIATEGSGTVQAALQHLAAQFYYGTANDAKGCPGLKASVNDAMRVDATGSTANGGSSVWAVRFGPNDVQWVMGENGMLQLDDPRIGDILDAEGHQLTGYIQEMLAYVGLQVRSIHSIGQIYNLTTQADKGLTDDRIAALLTKFKKGLPPHALLMSGRSQEQLRKSRTATNATGAPAPLPTEAFGIPIIPTDNILDTEAIE